MAFVLTRLQQALNRYIDESTAARDLRVELEGSSLAIDVVGTRLMCVMRSEGGRIVLRRDASEPPSATLTAAPLDLLSVIRAANAADLDLVRGDLAGNREVAAKFFRLFKLARPDLEEELSRWVGDLLARQVGRAAEDARSWLERAATALRMDASEFLQEESRILPGALEVQAFYDDIERLRREVERAAARLDELERRKAAACAASDSF